MLSIKIPGQKNPLTEEEKKYFSEKLNSAFQIGEQIGISGYNSSAYKLQTPKGEEYVLKIPNNPQDNRWVESQIGTEKISSHYLLGYEGKVVIPDMIELGQRYIVEPYCGVPLTAQLYDYTLSNVEKENIAQQMGYFLNFLHQQKPQNKIGNIEICAPNCHHSLSEVFTYFEPHLSKEENKEWEKRITSFINRDTSDEVATLTHGDIRSQNVLYNPQTKKVAVIDWETLRTRAVYRDFVPMASFGMSYHFLEKVVSSYNQAEKENDIKINLQKLLLLHLLSKYHEIGRCAIMREKKNQPHSPTPMKIILNKHIAPIEHIQQQLFERENC
ncbi:MAG: aminoglycoside phosphotransferase family protein [Alphaproteobacteria bacterium]|nr:aminoglycoside phosphotransferase family protein [Alphaproteobacteria bacterium]